jgi:hypothetical protein
MNCSDPPPLTDDQISAALDAVEDDGVRSHLARCALCAARLARARALERRLATTLYRWACPPAAALRDYHFGLAGQAEVAAVAAHVQGCPLCAADLDELVVFLAPDAAAPAAPQQPPAPRAWPRLRELVASLAPRAPALALRGAGAQPLLATVGDIAILIDFAPAGDGTAALIGQLVDADDQNRWTAALVEARQAAELRATATLDEDGGFSCAGLAPGPAELRITAPQGISVVLPPIEIAG